MIHYLNVQVRFRHFVVCNASLVFVIISPSLTLRDRETYVWMYDELVSQDICLLSFLSLLPFLLLDTDEAGSYIPANQSSLLSGH